MGENGKMQLRNTLIVFRKELKDMMRDRRTLVGMFLFPIVMFPLMTTGFNSFERRMRDRVKQERSTVMLLGAENAPALAEKLRASENLEVIPTAAGYAALIGDKKLHAAVEFPAGFEAALQAHATEAPLVKIYHYNTESRSEAAASKIEVLLGEYREGVVTQRLTARGLPEPFVKPLETKEENVAAPEKVSGSRLAIILPYFIIFLCLMGAIHPAMDLTAGEKERGTLETILASGVHRGDIVMGKFLLVLLVSLTTTVVSIASYGVTAAYSSSYMQQMTGGQSFRMSFAAIGAVLLVSLPLAVLFSSGLIAVSLYAKNYKEAQGYVGPAMFLVIVPAMAAMLPGVDLNTTLALIPIANVSLMMKELLTGGMPVGFLLATFASTTLYAGIALHIAYTLFQREDVLFRT